MSKYMGALRSGSLLISDPTLKVLDCARCGRVSHLPQAKYARASPYSIIFLGTGMRTAFMSVSSNFETHKAGICICNACLPFESIY